MLPVKRGVDSAGPYFYSNVDRTDEVEEGSYNEEDDLAD